ncbi:13461_t:CDS:2, partial [Gigaspora margarita]
NFGSSSRSGAPRELKVQNLEKVDYTQGFSSHQGGEIMGKRGVGHGKVTFEDSNLLLEKCYKTSTNCHGIVRKENSTVSERSDEFSSITSTKTMELYNRRKNASVVSWCGVYQGLVAAENWVKKLIANVITQLEAIAVLWVL